MTRKLCPLASSLPFVLFVAIMVLWVRSYRHLDSFFCPMDNAGGVSTRIGVASRS